MTIRVKCYTTSKDSDEFVKEQPVLQMEESGLLTGQSVRVETSLEYQEILGFGGAFTESASTTLDKMSDANRKIVLDAYFKENKYNFCRTHINSCDFSTGNYAYTETPDDVELKDFTLERDQKSLIPMIKDAYDINEDIILFASPWSPPAWMKTTNMMNQGGKLKDEYRQVWSEYYCRYIKEYEKEGIKIWGLTIQNEPEATQTWDSCVYTAADERDFIKNYLGPQLEKEGLGHVKIIIWDHNRDQMVERGRTVLSDPEAAKYVWGTGMHWYCGNNFSNSSLLHDMFPDKQIVFTEGCLEMGWYDGDWAMAERYGESVIKDLNNWTTAWTDWNMILDEQGGPNHVGNFCKAPIMCETKKDEVMFLPAFYYLGHFSRFIKRGAKRVLTATTHDQLEAVSCVNPNGEVVTVLMNAADDDQVIGYRYNDYVVETTVKARSMTTFVFEA